MRVMLDTNVLVSALLFQSNKLNRLIEIISMKHELVLATYVIDEFKDVIRSKIPQKAYVVDEFLAKASYELVYTPENIPAKAVSIRDVKDVPVIYSAIIGEVDVLVTGDKDFSDLNIEKLEILTPAEFLERFEKN